jgi:hypothetical protein
MDTVIGWGKQAARHTEFAVSLLRSILSQFFAGRGLGW